MDEASPEETAERSYGYPKPYYEAWDAMIATGAYWGLAPIHHGCFENGWRGALKVAAEMVSKSNPELAAAIRELGIYTNEDGSKELFH